MGPVRIPHADAPASSPDVPIDATAPIVRENTAGTTAPGHGEPQIGEDRIAPAGESALIDTDDAVTQLHHEEPRPEEPLPDEPQPTEPVEDAAAPPPDSPAPRASDDGDVDPPLPVDGEPPRAPASVQDAHDTYGTGTYGTFAGDRAQLDEFVSSALDGLEPHYVVNRHQTSIDYLDEYGFLPTDGHGDQMVDASVSGRDEAYVDARKVAEARLGLAGTKDIVYGSVQYRPVGGQLEAPIVDAQQSTHLLSDAEVRAVTGTGGARDAHAGQRIGLRQYGGRGIELRADTEPRMTFASRDSMEMLATRLGSREQLPSVTREWLLRRFGHIQERNQGNDPSARAIANQLLDHLLARFADPATRAGAIRDLRSIISTRGGDYHGYLEFQVHGGVEDTNIARIVDEPTSVDR